MQESEIMAFLKRVGQDKGGGRILMGDNIEDKVVHAAAVQVSVSFSLKFSSSNLRKIRFATNHPERSY
jgi:hypothetical protein